MPHEERVSLLRSQTVTNEKRLYIRVVTVLVFVFLERMAFYSLTSNMFLFLNQKLYSWTSYNAMNTLFIFIGIAYVSCLIGGIVADILLGRFVTILFGFTLFSIAYWFLFSLTDGSHCKSGGSVDNITSLLYENQNMHDCWIPLVNEPCSIQLLSVIVFAALGSGMSRANLVPFGAEQGHNRGQEFLRMYSNFFYWSVNLGGLVAILVIAYVQQAKGFYYGYMAPAICITLATVLLMCFYPLYKIRPRTKGVFSKIFDVLKEAYKANKRFRARLAERQSNSGLNPENLPSWIDMAKVTYGGKFHESVVEDVKSLRTIIIVFFFLVFYWLLYFQMQTSYLAQGLHMRLDFSSDKSYNESSRHFQIPAAWLTLFDVFILLVLIPLMDRIIYPYLDRHGLRIPLLCRILIGMLFACLSLLTAGTVEVFRSKVANSTDVIYQVIENTTFPAADMSIFYQTPQYLLMGFSEVFASIGGVEFACSQAPNYMQGAVMGLFYFFTGIGSFLGSLIVFVFQLTGENLHWNMGNIDKGHLYIYFFALSLLQFIVLVVFFFVSRYLKIQRTPVVIEHNVSNRVSLNGSQVSYDSIDRM